MAGKNYLKLIHETNLKIKIRSELEDIIQDTWNAANKKNKKDLEKLNSKYLKTINKAKEAGIHEEDISEYNSRFENIYNLNKAQNEN